MRRLAQPEVVGSAALAATFSAMLSLPRMLLWTDRKFPVWYAEATLFLGGFVLWAFVFAWHREYTRRPIFTLRIRPTILAAATLAGILAAAVSHFYFDPSLRTINPEEYPADFKHWIASALFALAFTQLFLVFAPYAWSVRLFRNERIAMALTVAIGVSVWLLRIQATPHPLPTALFIGLFAMRIIQAVLAVWFYLRGGILLVWWLGLLIETRHLLGFQGW
jgi:hypothetical protein